ncbi:S8 family serine peptidase [Kitasatospora purpeofusca]|uniref:S8 family serine peptidase n=1 Tax=Kitasatospora purpeofusca TaxID=67352 RepID=UPI0022568041|nr:S8 family serine peptidase [Kitasatospora purpeofusca]MCX4688594.1 S8 family serine peptidase [Kitasatospora purpeofusca]
MPDPVPPRFTPHLLVMWPPKTLVPRPPDPARGSNSFVTRPDRQGHVEHLLGGLEDAARASAAARDRAAPSERASGFAIRVEAAEGHSLDPDKLANSGLTLMSVRQATETSPQEALIWIPDARLPAFTEKISQFTEDTPGGHPKQNAAVANAEHIGRPAFDKLWQEDTPAPSADEQRWWELWFDPRLTEADQIATLQRIAATNGWQMTARSIRIGEYRVAHVATTGAQLMTLFDTNACPSEIRRPSFVEEVHTVARALQYDLAADLADRLEPPAADAPVVCILDTGVRQEHPLLKQALADRAQSVFANEEPGDHAGHGTQMAGLALLGDLAAALESNSAIRLAHGLESVKIVPKRITHDDTPRAHAEVTVEAVSNAETARSEQPRARVYSMAVTEHSTPDRNGSDGRASLPSATLDALAAGTSLTVHDDRIELIDAPDPALSRLIVVSAGNVRDHLIADLQQDDGTLHHLGHCDLSRIEDPPMPGTS